MKSPNEKNITKPLVALKKAIELAGGQSALAKICGVKQQHVWNWINRDKKISPEHVIPIEKGLDGKITRHDLRPDIYPNEE